MSTEADPYTLLLDELEDDVGDAEYGDMACQHPTGLARYGLPGSTCGAPAVEYRPDREFVRYVCGNHRGEDR